MTEPDFLPYGRHLIEDDDIEAVVKVLKSDHLTGGPVVEEFEEAFAEKVGAKYAVACSSGTAGLHMCMLALGVAGKRVLVPDMTFIATASAVEMAGGETVLSDVSWHQGLMTLDHMRAACRDATAVIPVHLNGQASRDMSEIAGYARSRAMYVVEDATHALGGAYDVGNDLPEWPVGGRQDTHAAVFSLHPVKAIAAGEGGVVTTHEVWIANRLRELRDNGRNKARADLPARRFGLNYKPSAITCALALSQLGKLDRFIERRRELAALYKEAFTKFDPNQIQYVLQHEGSAWHLMAVRLQKAAPSQHEVRGKLANRGIGTQVHYEGVHAQHPYREKYGQEAYTGSRQYSERVLSLPLFPAMRDSDVERVVTALHEVLAGQ